MNTITRLENQIREIEQAIDLLRRIKDTHRSSNLTIALGSAIRKLNRQSNELQYEIADLYDINSESHDR